MSDQNLTPMMRQYNEAKAACGGALLLFRMGDFYELFHDDAKTAAQVLGLALTSRDKGTNAMPMAGFPHHQLDAYIGKLIRAGYRAAVCEQMEDPRKAKGLVKRSITRIVSPGTVTEDALLDPRQSNYLAACVPMNNAGKTQGTGKRTKSGETGGVNDDGLSSETDPVWGLAWVELSTGKFLAATVPETQLNDHLARIAPAELLIPDNCPKIGRGAVPPVEKAMLTKRPEWAFGYKTAVENLQRHFRTLTFEGFGFSGDDSDVPALRAAGAVLDYLTETQKHSLEHIDTLAPYLTGRQMEIDEASRRSLEISRTLRGNRRDASLLGVLDHCVTSMGARLLDDWIAAPLLDIAEIETRQDTLAELLAMEHLVPELRDLLKKVSDLERLGTRVVQGRATPRTLSDIGRTLRVVPDFRDRLRDISSPLLRALRDLIDPCEALSQALAEALVDECPINSREGGFIRDGFLPELDELRQLRSGGKEWIAAYQASESERTGIAKLKVGFNRVFGYYIEITNVNRDNVPESYIRKQTLKNAERYITPELKEYEEKVLLADDRACALEADIFDRLVEQTVACRSAMHKTAAAFAHLDVLANLALLARQRGYCRPRMVPEAILDIVDGRHPVLDALETQGTFVPNDVRCNEETGRIQLITGPNMSGKSTFIRQIALLTLMSQIGSYIPAREATLGLTDRIFARVGASDELSRGQSTFMVEMTETARILNTATSQSLVILDEIGRGTSTYDGISLAWAIVEYLHDQVGCRTFFATHYHELTELEESFAGIVNLNVAVREHDEDIAFLHKIVSGAADKSYGIHVARLAGVPRRVLRRAGEILEELERSHVKAAVAGVERDPAQRLARRTANVGRIQFSLFGPDDHPVIEELRRVELDELTPMEAFRLLDRWKKRL